MLRLIITLKDLHRFLQSMSSKNDETRHLHALRVLMLDAAGALLHNNSSAISKVS